MADFAQSRLYTALVDSYAPGSVAVSDLVEVALHAMQLAEDEEALAGAAKKALVAQVLRRVVDEAGVVAAADADAARAFLESTLPTLIDVLVDVAKTGGSLVAKKVRLCCGGG